MFCKINNRIDRSVVKKHGTLTLFSILNMLKWISLFMFLLSPVASAQSIQTIDSEAELASLLCRNPDDGATNEQLLNQNAQLVNTTLWNALLNCALSAEHQQSPTKSIRIYKLTLRLADRLNKPELIATTYYYLGRAYSGMNDFESSIQAYETSRKLFEETGANSNLVSVLADLGASYLATEDCEKAHNYSQQSLAIAERITANPEALARIEYGKARAVQTLGALALHDANFDDALSKLDQAVTLYGRLNARDSSYNIKMADALIILAQVYGEMGQYGQAFSCLTKARDLSKSSDDQNTLANIMSSQGSLLLDQEDYAAAQTYFNASLAIYRSCGNAREESRVLLSLAIIQDREGHQDDAVRLFHRTLKAATAAKLVDVQITAGQGLSVALTAKRDFANALKSINESLELARRVSAKTREAELLWHSAQTYYAMRNYRDAISLAEQALTMARSLRLPKLTYLATATLGDAYAADNKVELAITTLKEAITQTEALRDRVAGRQEGQLLFFENKVGPYHTLIELLTEQGKNFEALTYAERAKGRVLLEAVRNNRSDLKDIYTESEKAEAEFLINKLHTINQRIKAQASEGVSKEDLQNQLNGVRSELILFQNRLAVAHPELPLRAGPAQPLTHASLNRLIPANDFAYVEYVVTSNSVGVFILKRSGVNTEHALKYVKLPVDVDELRQKVYEFHSKLAERQPGYEALGRELYRLLIEPIAVELRSITSICIVPDDFLWILPFQALRPTSDSYLIQAYSLLYAPSLSALNEMALRRRQPKSRQSLIAFANPVINRNDGLKDLHPLPETETEVAAVTKALRTTIGKVFVGSKANEKTFKDLAPQYAAIHLATHGVLDNKDPLNSHLLLTKTDDDPENDGLLQAREIMNMRLDADLAVLSACETGNGRISPGEGVIGMSWAFFVAGARSVVVSQWRVNSASTSQLMKNFYQAMARQSDQKGLNKSQALREASLVLLKDRRYGHPFYWAGFILLSSN